MNERVKRAVESLRRIRERKLARSARACFCDDRTGAISHDGERVLADLRNHAKLFNSGIRRDSRGVIDRDELLRLEGRRELVLRLINLLELDARVVGQFVEVDDERV